MAWMESNGRTRPARPGRLIAGTPPDETFAADQSSVGRSMRQWM
jgi:hypothetical protein